MPFNDRRLNDALGHPVPAAAAIDSSASMELNVRLSIFFMDGASQLNMRFVYADDAAH